MQQNSRQRYALALAIVSCLAFNAPATAGDSCCSVAASPTLSSVAGEDFTFDTPEDGCHPVRFHQARYLIGEANDFITTAKQLHEKVENQLLIAKTLKGEANMMFNQMPAVAPPKLKGAALQAAMGDYQKDLRKFVANADKYQLNLQTFRTTIGECQRAQADYQRQRNLYDLHCSQFHVANLTNIEPPHICGALNVTEGEASRIAGMLRADQQKLQQTMGDLNTKSQLLNESRNIVASNLTATATESIRQREEEKLAKEFGRLREEYEMLKIQAKVLGPDKQKEAGKLVQRSVSGNVVGKSK